MFAEQRSNPIICRDATTIDYEKLLDEHYSTRQIDYLQLVGYIDSILKI
jgi:hypothetical protein